MDATHFEGLLRKDGMNLSAKFNRYRHNEQNEIDDTINTSSSNDNTGLSKNSHEITTGIIGRVGKQRSLSEESHNGYESLKDVRRRR